LKENIIEDENLKIEMQENKIENEEIYKNNKENLDKLFLKYDFDRL
jgi:hypothetical protein